MVGRFEGKSKYFVVSMNAAAFAIGAMPCTWSDASQGCNVYNHDSRKPATKSAGVMVLDQTVCSGSLQTNTLLVHRRENTLQATDHDDPRC